VRPNASPILPERRRRAMKNPHIRGLGEMVLRVKNLGVMKEFYARVLGFSS
jgi:catechol-2,3-dioxygenase